MSRPTGHPICMSANTEALIANHQGLNGAGQVGQLDAGRLRNEYRSPILVTEIDFTISLHQSFASLASVDGTPRPFSNIGGYILAQIAIGGYKMTNRFVPIWMLGRRYGLGSEMNDSDVNFYRWVLPKPMLVLPNTSFEVDIQVSKAFATIFGTSVSLGDGVSVEFAAKGYTVDPDDIDMSSTAVPYASAFVSDGSPTSNLMGPELALHNPFQIPLRVQRLVGRIELYDQTSFAAPVALPAGLFPDVPQDGTMETEAGVILMVDLQDSTGYRLTANPHPFGFLFYPDATWRFERDLQPGDSYFAVLTNPVNADGTTFPIGTNYRPQIGLVGHRVETLQVAA